MVSVSGKPSDLYRCAWTGAEVEVEVALGGWGQVVGRRPAEEVSRRWRWIIGPSVPREVTIGPWPSPRDQVVKSSTATKYQVPSVLRLGLWSLGAAGLANNYCLLFVFTFILLQFWKFYF